MRRVAAVAMLFVLSAARAAPAAEISVTYAQALGRAARLAPDIAVARTAEAVAQADTRIAGLLPNPTLSAGTTTQTARLSVGVAVPLLILGQRGAAVEAARAELATTRVETDIARADVRAFAAHAFVVLWRAQAIAFERGRAAAIAGRLEEAVRGRVEVGAAATVDGLRAHAERLRAEADAQQSSQLQIAAADDLARWIAFPAAALHAEGDPAVPALLVPLADLRARLEDNPVLQRERAAAHAAEMRADRERAFVRPILSVDLGLDAWDHTLCPGDTPCGNPPINYRGGLAVELPLLNARGPYVDRELSVATVARTKESAERVRLTAALTTAYTICEAWSVSARTLGEGVVPAADAAAAAMEESFALGRAPLFAVLDAEKAGIDARLSLLEARAQQADAWIEVEHAVGMR
jgi:cobalt-zinc-cadmium efflux system outer membrane protein